MVHDVEGVEVCWALCYHHSLCSRNSCSIHRQFADATEREAGKKFTVRYRRESTLYGFYRSVYLITLLPCLQTDFRHHPEVSLLRKTPLQLQWCSDLRFIGQKSSPFKLKVMPLETFPGHKINNKISFVIESNHVMLKSSDKSDDQQKLGIVSSTKSDNNEFKDSGSREKPITALASFPGSGNTWLRYLLQQATGILTGSVYKDYGLLKSGFPAESIANTSVLLVKTHEWGSHVWSKFGKAILLVR